MRLFKPIKIGSLEIKNRIVMSAMDLGLSTDGLINDKIVNFYAARAAGGVGLITVGGVSPSTNGKSFFHFLVAADDSCIAPFIKFNKVIHGFNAKSSIQLLHAGRYAHPAFNKGETPVSASAVPSRFSPNLIPHTLSVAEIKEVVQEFARAARRAKEGGFDAVEIHAGMGYLINQFISPAVNQREDKYGGSFENRLRFACEVIEAIKNACGDDFPLIARIAGEDHMKDGYRLEEYIMVAERFEEYGVDALVVSPLWHESPTSGIFMRTPDRSFVYLASEIKKAVKIPVIAGMRMRGLVNVEDLLISGTVDMIYLGRPLIADPELSNKLKEGRENEILPCASCSTCFDEVASFNSIACMLNPMVGQEEEVKITKAEKIKKVVVVGGGPAGIKAALTASERGHDVILYEARDEIGGYLRLCSMPEGRDELEKALIFFKNQLRRSKVEVVLWKKIGKQNLLGLKPDAAVIATGSVPIIPDIPGIEKEHVVAAEDLLEKNIIPGKNVVVIGGGLVGCEVALTIARKGAMSPESAVFLLQHDIINAEQAKKYTLRGDRKVTIVEKMRSIGRGFGKSSRWMVLKEMEMSGVEVLTNSEVMEIKDKSVIVSGKDKKEIKMPADTVVIAVGYSSNKSGFKDLDKEISKVYYIGDAVEPRKIRDAIKEGFEIGNRL